MLAGDTHRSLITARHTPSGGYWLVRAPSLADYPQQARAFRLVALADGRVALATWMLDQAGNARRARLPRPCRHLARPGVPRFPGRPATNAWRAGDPTATSSSTCRRRLGSFGAQGAEHADARIAQSRDHGRGEAPSRGRRRPRALTSPTDGESGSDAVAADESRDERREDPPLERPAHGRGERQQRASRRRRAGATV